MTKMLISACLITFIIPFSALAQMLYKIDSYDTSFEQPPIRFSINLKTSDKERQGDVYCEGGMFTEFTGTVLYDNSDHNITNYSFHIPFAGIDVSLIEPNMCLDLTLDLFECCLPDGKAIDFNSEHVEHLMTRSAAVRGKLECGAMEFIEEFVVGQFPANLGFAKGQFMNFNSILSVDLKPLQKVDGCNQLLKRYKEAEVIFYLNFFGRVYRQ